MRVACGRCKASIEMDDAQTQISNFVSCTVITIEHPEQVVCPGCGALVTLFVAGAQLAFAAAPVPPRKQKTIVVPGGRT
jgi:hypothetical protein